MVPSKKFALQCTALVPAPDPLPTPPTPRPMRRKSCMCWPLTTCTCLRRCSQRAAPGCLATCTSREAARASVHPAMRWSLAPKHHWWVVLVTGGEGRMGVSWNWWSVGWGALLLVVSGLGRLRDACGLDGRVTSFMRCGSHNCSNLTALTPKR
jgi:hypothetical protein